MKDIVIVGSSGQAKDIAFLIKSINKTQKKWNFLGFIDENIGQSIGGFKIIMNDNDLLSYKEKLNVIIGVGFPKLLKKLAVRFKENKNLIFPNLIEPTCIGDWERIKFGEGNILTARNTLSTDITIGSFNIFNVNGTVGHDTKVGSYNVFNPTNNISGNVIINDEILVGTGAQILQGLTICNDSIIGAGAVLSKNIDVSGVYVGIPAKRIK